MKKSKIQRQIRIRYNRKYQKSYYSRQKVIDLFNDYAKIRSDATYKTKQGPKRKILTSKRMLRRLPIALAQVKAGNNSEISK